MREHTIKPLISCLMVTQPGREPLIRKAMACFRRQTYERRELVVVHDGLRSSDAFDRFLKKEVKSAKVIWSEAGKSLGELRNLALEAAKGELVCQWDDDDQYHPKRLAWQWQAIHEAKADACFLASQLHYFTATSDLYLRDLGRRGIEGTVMHRRDLPVRYPAMSKEEDTIFMRDLVTRYRTTVMQGFPWLYLRIFHGDNTWGEDHHRHMMSRAWKVELLRKWKEEIARQLQFYDLELPVTVRGCNGRAFAIPKKDERQAHVQETSSPAQTAKNTASKWAVQLTEAPPVSCICPTYGRVDLLEEAVYSFLQQDYPGPKELIVLNDYARQLLSFDHPEVRVVNLPQRFDSVGEKYNAAADLCTHDLIFVWHDDDIYLPHRISFSVANFSPDRQFFKADRAWFWNSGQISGPGQTSFHGGSCWTRELFVEMNGYPHSGNDYDISFESRCRRRRSDTVQPFPTKLENIYYIYRWQGTGSYHFSVIDKKGKEHEKVAAYVRKKAEAGKIQQGQVTLNPHWKADYQSLVRDYRESGQLQKIEAERRKKEVPFPPPFQVIPPPEPMPDESVEALFKGNYPLKISVILPACNESVLLKRTVAQFEATLPANSEIIVVDNGSSDKSADFLINEPREHVHLIQTTEPLGVAGARNRGLAMAQGEVVVFSDAHIDIPERWWQPIVATLNRPGVGMVGPGIGPMGTPANITTYGQRIIETNLQLKWLTERPAEPCSVPTLGGGFMAMHHDTLKTAGAFDSGMPQWGSEDMELCIRYWLLGYEVWTVPSVTVLHYFRKASPYSVDGEAVTHNKLRVALLHFNQGRLSRIVSALKDRPEFASALAQAVDSDVWQQRAAFAGRRQRDDDWFFEMFKDNCSRA